MRNLSKTIAAVSLLVPASAYSLGIGDIQLHSALNQNLDAEISLLVSEDENVADLKVRLASPDKFEEAGVPWNYFLSKIKFKPVTLPDGSTIVKVSSREAFREPFLDFLLEVSWDKGSIYREFTVLLDPPVAYMQPVVPVVQKPQQIAKKQQQPPAVIPAVKENASNTNTIQSKEYNTTKTAIDKYGPTKRNESIWKIAEKTNAFSNVSREQMMMALFNANPQAFSNNNINSLLIGKTLEIPARNTILNLSRKEAIKAFQKQSDEWRGYVTAKKSQADSKKQKAGSQSANAQLDLKAPTEAQIAAADNVVSKGGNVTEPGSGISSEEGAVLKDKIDKLEQQISMMQKMLVLKNEQIAALQNKNLVKQVGAGEAPKGAETAKGIDKPVETPVKQDPVKVAEIDPKQVTPGKVVEKVQPKTEKKPELKPVTEVKTKTESDSDLLSSEMLAAIGIPVLGLLGWFLWRKRKADEELDSESMFASATEISLPKDNEGELFASSQEDVSSFYETIDVDNSLLSEFASSDLSTFDTEQTEVDPILEADVYLAYGRYQQAEELMREAIVDQPERDECKLKLLEILHANENVTAYEAYAAELMDSGKQSDTVFWDKVVDMGVELNPESEFFAQDIGNKATFEIDDSDRDSSQLEDSVLTDGLFSDSVEDDSQGELSAEDTEEVSENEMEFDLSIFDEDETDQDNKTAEVSENNGLDFDLNEFDLDKTSKNQVTGTDEISDIALEAENLESSEFDFDSIMADDSESNKSIDEDHESEFKDFDFDSSDVDTKPSNLDNIELNDIELKDIELNNIELNNIELNAIELDDEADSAQNIEGFDFSMDDNVSSEEAMLALESSKQETEKFNLFDFDKDVDISSSSMDGDIEQSDISDLGSMDEMETKVDLAKAYIDMGDFDSAKVIAEEVLLNGNNDQQKAAQSIIQQVEKV